MVRTRGADSAASAPACPPPLDAVCLRTDSPEIVHTLVSSALLLNTDLHSGRVERKMKLADFVKNVMGALTEGEHGEASAPPEHILVVRFATGPPGRCAAGMLTRRRISGAART